MAGGARVAATLAFASGLIISSVQAADTGPRAHAQGQYDAQSSTYTVVSDDDLDAIGERFGVPVAELRQRNKLQSDRSRWANSS